MIEKILNAVPHWGKAGLENDPVVRHWFMFQKDIEPLVETADYAEPEFTLGSRNIVYDPVHDEFSFVDEPQPERGSAGSILAGFFGTLVAVSLMRTVMTVQWRKSWRAFVTLHLGSAPRPIHNYRRLRSAFADTPVHGVSAFKNHSHGTSAGDRLAAIQWMNAVCVATGLTRYSFQMSANEQSHNVPGERLYYWAKDASAEPQFDVAGPENIISLIDVDYYVNMPEHLAYEARPHLLYTIQPETAGFTGKECSYSFDAQGRLVWRVSGGASYTHHVWNYGVDHFVVSRTFFGIPYKTVLYDVQARRLGPDRQVVMLAPIRVFYGIASFFAHYMAPQLKRLDPVIGKFAKVVTYGTAGKRVSVAALGAETSCTIPGTVFDALLAQRNISPQARLNAYQTKSMLSHVDADDLVLHKDLIAGVLTEYMNTAPDKLVDPLQVVERTTMTQVAFETPDPSDKPCLVPFAMPFGVPPAFVPVNNKASSDQSIVGRVLLPREQVENLLGEFKMTPFKQQAIEAFVTFLVPAPHRGVPYDYAAVAEKQVRPGQRQDLQAAGLLGRVSDLVKTFMKREAYGKPTDPRNITTFNAKTKIDYAHYMYPIMDHMKAFPFYAFGRTPKEVALRLTRICTESETVACPDIHRMDGFVNQMCRGLERAVGLRFFAPEFADGFCAAHEASYGNVGVTTHGKRYEQEFSRGSGEMGTSVWNTVINLFIMFYAHALTHRDFDSAWDYLMDKVIAGGDDGGAGDMDDARLIRAARDCGFILKCPVYRRGEAGVNFLARVYGPDVWNGDPNSMCSLRRQLEKFHLTVAVPLSPAQKMFEKALSFMHTDANTPILGPLVRAIIQACPGYTSTRTITRWGDDVEESEQYPNDCAAWMRSIAEEELPLTNLDDFENWLTSMPAVDELLNAPVFYHEGREFTYEEYDPTPGMLIKRTRDVLQPPKLKRQKAVMLDPSKITFGDDDTDSTRRS